MKQQRFTTALLMIAAMFLVVLATPTAHALSSATDYYNNDVSEQISAEWETKAKAEFISKKRPHFYRKSEVAKQPNPINRYTLEIIKNGGGWRGLLINFKTELVERRTVIFKQKNR